MTDNSILERYKQVFGEYPVFTGINFDDDFPYEKLINAIDTGIAYIEQEVPEGAKA
jgi:hypothetical protein